jgi:hypothetical protein
MVFFEVEVTSIRRYTNPGYDYADVEIEHTDFLCTYSAGMREDLHTILGIQE